MRPDRKAKPLYRKVNTRTHGVRHGCARLDQPNPADVSRQSMRQGLRHGLDYTPLFRFLLSRVGQVWDEVFFQAQKRLDHEEPIWWLVARPGEEPQATVRLGESSYYSGLMIDDDGILALVDPSLDAQDMRPDCPCCTHTFNGERFGLAYGSPDSDDARFPREDL